MALIVDIRVNSSVIGRLSCVQRELVEGDVHRYECSALMFPHPTTGEQVDTDPYFVEHPYSESAFDLIRRAIEAMPR